MDRGMDRYLREGERRDDVLLEELFEEPASSIIASSVICHCVPNLDGALAFGR